MKKLFNLLFIIGILTSCEQNNTIAQAPPITVPVPVPDSVAILGDWLEIYFVDIWNEDTTFSSLTDSLIYIFTTDSFYINSSSNPVMGVYTYSLDTQKGDLFIDNLQLFSYVLSNDTLIISGMTFPDGIENTFIRY